MKFLEKEKKVIQMKKKLLAVVLAVVMLAAVLVPVLAVSAAAPTATISLGTPTKTTRTGNDGVVYDVIALDVNLSGNTEDQGFFTARYKVISEDGLECYFSDHSKPAKVDKGFDKGDYTDGDSSLNITVGQLSEGGKNWFQVVQDSTNSYGVYADAGKLITVYFMAPTEIGEYTFTLEWMDGTDDTPVQYDMTVNPATQKYVVECTNHVEGTPEVVEEAKCGVAGKEVVKCTVCGKELKTNTIPALEHEWDNGVAAEGVACGSTADVTYTCKLCGETKVETGAKVEHSWVEDTDAYVAPKCGVAGKKVYNCENENCTVKTKEESVKALEHVWDNGTADASKVCGETADVVYACTNEGCDETKTEAGAKIEHDWKLDESKHVDAKCGEEGKDVYVCQRANCPVGEKEEKIPALEHDWGEYELTKAPTADAEGEYTAECKNGCGEVDTKAIAKLATEIKKENLTIKAEDAVLPDDITVDSKEAVEDKETGKYVEEFKFASELVDLEGKAVVTIDSKAAGKFENVEVFVKNDAGELVAVEATYENGVLTFEADLAAEYTLTYNVVKEAPATADSSNVIVFAVVGIIALAALVIVGKKRFAL